MKGCIDISLNLYKDQCLDEIELFRLRGLQHSALTTETSEQLCLVFTIYLMQQHQFAGDIIGIKRHPPQVGFHLE